MVKKEEQKNLFLTIMLALAAVAFWRGAWGIMDIYLFPSNPIISFVVSLFLGLLILYVIKPKLKIK